MDANTVIAVCSVVIAVASLGVSAYVARATREHNRLSVRPLLKLSTTFVAKTTAGLLLTNSGLGPARIIDSQLTFGEEELGEFNQPTVNKFKDRLQREHLQGLRPHAATLGGHPYLATDQRLFLLSVNDYNPDADGVFARLIEGQLRLTIQYESIYGERFTEVYPRREWASLPPAEDGP